MSKKCLPIIFLLILTDSFAQTLYPNNYFRSPVDTTIALAGNFGEIRPNHFHAGFDIKTNGKEGMPVYAVADGYIARIRISAFGYGKALYLVHPNGFTSVYGHLRNFGEITAAFAKNVQYKQQSFEIDTLLNPEVFPVKKGQLIAYSGNTGGSEAPHLHFEIRETDSEKPINPYFFGYKIPDNTKPEITGIAIYPIGETASINGKHAVKKIKPLKVKGDYFIPTGDSIVANGDIGFGVEAYDTENKSTNQNGVFSIELLSGGKRIYYHELEKLSFENSRYVNAHIDYEEKQKNNRKIQKCFLSKNNKLEIYKNVVNNGIINFTDDSIHWIKLIIKDFNGNASQLMMKVKSKSKIKVIAKISDPQKTHFDCLKENKIIKDDIQISVPPLTLYDDIDFSYSSSTPLKNSYSPVYHIMNTLIPAQRSYELGLKAIKLPDSLQDKACIISISDKGKRTFEGGNYINGFVVTQTKTFGNFAVVTDTSGPKLKPLFNYVKDKTVDLHNSKKIGIIAKDDLSGIKKYNAFIDGNWVLCEYEFKEDLLFYTFDENVSPGAHRFNIEVTDGKGNISKWKCTFIK
jgi:hypothetical protein